MPRELENPCGAQMDREQMSIDFRRARPPRAQSMPFDLRKPWRFRWYTRIKLHQLPVCAEVGAMSLYGPSRHFAATQQLSRYRSEADIQRAGLTELDL